MPNLIEIGQNESTQKSGKLKCRRTFFYFDLICGKNERVLVGTRYG